MPLTPTPDLVAKGPIPAFNIIQLEHITAILGGAARAGRPVILQISENAVRYHGALAPWPPRPSRPRTARRSPPPCISITRRTRPWSRRPSNSGSSP